MNAVFSIIKPGPIKAVKHWYTACRPAYINPEDVVNISAHLSRI